jgi:hypothetical protein
MLRVLWLLLIWPFRLCVFVYMRARGMHRNLIVELDIHGDYPETPLSHGLWAMIKPARDRFYLLALYLQNILNGVRHRKLKVKRLRIVFESHSLGWAQAWELRSLLAAIRQAGVETHAYLLNDSRVSLFAASACERVVAPESAGFDLTPFTGESVFLQSLLAKVGVRPQFMSVGEFKSAAEIFTRKGFSPQARRQTEELIADLETQFWLAIGEKTGKITRTKNRGLYSAAAALREKLIDGISGMTEFCEQPGDAKKWRTVDLYAATQILRRRTFAAAAFRRRKKIALIVAEGNIIESHNSRPGSKSPSTLGEVTGTGSGFNYAVLNGSSKVIGLLNLLGKDTNVNLLSAPHVMAADGRIAKIEVGNDEPVVTQTVQAAASTLTGLSTSNSVQYRPTGLILEVKPTISANGIVSMAISQEVSSRIGSVLVGGSEYPSFSKRRVTTDVSVEEGKSLLIAGLIEDKGDDQSVGIPGAKDIPLFGALFGTSKKVKTKTELLITITPHIVNNAADADRVALNFSNALSELKNVVNKSNVGARLNSN